MLREHVVAPADGDARPLARARRPGAGGAARPPACRHKAKTPQEAYKRLDGRRDGERRRRALRRARPGDALELDVDPEVPPRGVRHRPQQLSRGARCASARRAASSTPRRRRRRASCSCIDAAPGAPADAARRWPPGRARSRPARPRTGRGGAGVGRARRAEAQRATAAGASPGSASAPRTTRTAPTTIWRWCARARPTTSARPRAPANEPQAAERPEQEQQQLSLTLRPRSDPTPAAPPVAPRRAAVPAPIRPAGPSRAGAATAVPAQPRIYLGHRALKRGARHAGEPLRRRARRGRGVGAQALGHRAHLLPLKDARRSSTA